MLIFLVGMPGCGKSTISHDLSIRLNLKRVDLDEEIVKREGTSIENIFSSKGEDYFREVERDVVKRSCHLEDTIVSAGGGAPCFFDNIEKMNQAGVTVFLDVPVETLAERISSNDPNRPMVKDKTKEEVIDFLKQKRNERLPFYSQARITLTGANIQTEEIVERIKTS